MTRVDGYLRCVQYESRRRGELFQAAYISFAVLSLNRCGLFVTRHRCMLTGTDKPAVTLKDTLTSQVSWVFLFFIAVPVKVLLELSHLIVLHRREEKKEHVWYLICLCVGIMKYFVMLSLWLFGILHLKMHFPSLWRFAMRETGSMWDVPVAELWLPW